MTALDVLRRLPITQVTERDRRTLSRGAVTISVLLLASKGVPAWFAWTRDTRMAAADVTAEAARADATIAAMPVLRDSLRARSGRALALAPLILEGDSPAASAAALGSLVSDAASDAGVRLGGIHPRVDSTTAAGSPARASGTHRGAFAEVVVQGELTGDIVGVTQFLADLEHGPALLRFRELTISQPEPAAPTSRMEALHVEFTVDGLALATLPARNGSRAVGSGP